MRWSAKEEGELKNNGLSTSLLKFWWADAQSSTLLHSMHPLDLFVLDTKVAMPEGAMFGTL